MVILEPRNMHWILEPENEDHDLCAHGDIYFEVNNYLLVDESDGRFTVSAAALFLLRTLEKDYIAKFENENLIFPCCGFEMISDKNSDNCFILGCHHGVDFDVLHRRDKVKIVFEGCNYRIPEEEWREAVLHFSDLVKAFYNASSQKNSETWLEEYRDGYEVFLAEWDRRVKAARAIDQA